MARAIFEHEGNCGLLTVTTHFDRTIQVAFEKQSDEIFRLGGTAVHDVATYEGVLLKTKSLMPHVHFRAFRSVDSSFEGVGLISDEIWPEDSRHCYVTEYYPLDMEGQKPGWFVSYNPIKDANYLFVNLDILDGGGNLIKRCRVSPFTGEHRIMEGING